MPAGPTRIYVGNITEEITKRDLEDEFDKCAAVLIAFVDTPVSSPVSANKTIIRFGRVDKVWIARNPPVANT